MSWTSTETINYDISLNKLLICYLWKGRSEWSHWNKSASMPRGLVLFAGSERRLLLHPDSPPPQAALTIHLRGSGLSIHSPSLWAVPSSPHFYEVHGYGSVSAETAGNPHLELPWRLAHPGPVGGRASISQIHAPQPLRVPRTQGQFCQECAVPQPTNFVPGNSYRAMVTQEHALAIQQFAASFKLWAPHPLKVFQRMLGLMASAWIVLVL